MPIIYEDDQIQVIETVTANGKTVQTIYKPGTAAFNRDSVLVKAQQAIGLNATYLAIPSPTTAQNTAQTKRLTREVNALLRLLLNDLADVSDT